MVDNDPFASSYERFFVKAVRGSTGMWAFLLSLGFVLLVSGLVCLLLAFNGQDLVPIGVLMSAFGLVLVLFANLVRGGREYLDRVERPRGGPL